MGNDYHGGPGKDSVNPGGFINYKGSIQVNKSIDKAMHKNDECSDCFPEGSFYPENLKQSLINTGFIESGIHKLPLLRIADKMINSFADLISVIESVPELSLKYLMSGVLDRWASGFNSGLARDIAVIKNSGYDDTEKLSTLLFLLDPTRQCRIEKCDSSPYNFGPYTISEQDDFLELLRNEPDNMIDMMFMVPVYFRPDFYPWIDIHYMKLSFLLNNLKRKINSGLVPDLLREMNSIYIALSGERIRPFKNYNYIISDINDLINIPSHDRYRVIEELKENNSILYLWLFSEKRMSRYIERWESMDKTWDNLIKLVCYYIL